MPHGSILSCLAAAGLAAAQTPGPAAGGTLADLAPAFGNTVVSTHPDGRRARLWLNSDRTYTAQGRKGQRSGGVWSLKGGKLCLSQKSPYPGPFPACKRLPKVKVGGRWSDVAFNGERVTNELLRGR